MFAHFADPVGLTSEVISAVLNRIIVQKLRVIELYDCLLTGRIGTSVQPSQQRLEVSIEDDLVVDYVTNLKNVGMIALGDGRKLLPVKRDEFPVLSVTSSSRNQRRAFRPGVEFRTCRDHNAIF